MISRVYLGLTASSVLTYIRIHNNTVSILLNWVCMGDILKLEQLGKYEKHYIKKNDCMGALESLLEGINDKNETQEIRSIAYSMYEEYHTDNKKRIIRNIAIVSTIMMPISFGIFLLVRYLNPIVDIKLPLEVVLLTLTAICLLMLCYQFIKYESMEYNNRCVNEQDKNEINITKDSDNIVMLRTRLKKLTDCVKLKGHKQEI